MFPSGKFNTFGKFPKITIVPGFTPPIVEPVGYDTYVSLDDKIALPSLIVLFT